MITIAALAACCLIAPPETPKASVTDSYHGVPVMDDFRWLEDWSDPKVKAWSEAQNAFAREHLDSRPDVEKIRVRMTEIMSAQSVRYLGLHAAGGKVFAIKRQPPKQQPMLVVLDSADKPESEQVILDPNALDPKGLTAIDWAVPSHDGKLVAVSVSLGGSESGDVHVFDAATGKETGDVVARVNGGTAGGSVAWSRDNKGFFYSRYPREGERPAADMDFYTQVYFHKLGTESASDGYELGKAKPASQAKADSSIDGQTFEYGRTSRFEFTRIAEIRLQSEARTGRVLCTVQHGDGGTFAHYLRSETGEWSQIADYSDQIVQMAFGPSNTLLMISRKGAPRGCVLSLAIGNASSIPGVAAAKTLIPEGKGSIISEFPEGSSLVVTSRALFVTYQMGGPTEIRTFDHQGGAAADPQQAPIADASDVTDLGDGSILFSLASYVKPQAWFHFDPASGTTKRTALEVKSPVNFDDCEVVREFAVSKDGTKVPVNIVRRKGMSKNGSNPCLVTGYGGYGVNIAPTFTAARRALIEQGFVWAQVNLRGGGEFGEQWHRDGALTKKQNVFDDFAAACKYMVDEKYTNAKMLAIEGGSNGGLLMGATLTQHPELCTAVVSHVGIYDMLHVELSSNGAFNIPEFGTVNDKEQFAALYAYSPYHHVKVGVKYPSVLFLTGANDPRVDPMQSRKMTAILQSARADVLLRTSASSGHGMGTALSEQIEQAVDINAWLFDRLDVKYTSVK
jgi:prolyl oligopeptidase